MARAAGFRRSRGADTFGAMRHAVWALALLLAACAGTGGSGGSGDPASAELSGRLFPFHAAAAVFETSRGAEKTVSVDPVSESVARMTISDASGSPRRIDVHREGGALFFRNGPSRGTELVRFGASPGDEWDSEDGTVRFEGWERVEVPAGVYDAARISARSGTEDVPRVDTWWLAPDVGMVRLKSDWGGMFTETMVRKRDGQ